LFFAAYTVAAVVYRTMILFGVIWFLYQVFEPYGLKVLSQTLAVVSIGSLVVMPVYKLWKFFSVPGKVDKMKRKNINITLGVLTAIIAFIVFVPLPYRVICSLELKPRGADPIYTVVPGLLEEVFVKAGDRVAADAKLAQLSNIDLVLEIAEIKSKIQLQEAALQIATLALSENQQSESAARELPQIEESLEGLKDQLREKEQDLERLTLRAHTAGIVLPPPNMPEKPDRDDRALRTWSGSPMEPKNLGALLTGVLFCQIGDPTKWDALLYIDQDDIDFIKLDQDVDILLDKYPSRRFSTKISMIGPEVEVTPTQLSSKSGGEFMSKVDKSGQERPMNTSYRALAPIDDANGNLVQGLRGSAKVYTAWQPIGRRVWRYMIRTFNFKL
jgi:putative peptide zinc metalloprotease protein